MQDQKPLTLHWRSFPWWGREQVSPSFDYKGVQYIQKEQQCTIVNILRFTVGYLNATINRTTLNVEPEIGPDGSSPTWRNPSVDEYAAGLDCHEAACPVFGWVKYRTEPFIWSQPGPLAGYLDPLLTLIQAKTDFQRHKEANKINIWCGSTLVESNEISMPPGCRLKFGISVYSLWRYERHSQCWRGML